MKKPLVNKHESNRKYIIKELQGRNVNMGKDGTSIHSMDYFSLLSLLAIQRAVES